jgi:hypothetical protein
MLLQLGMATAMVKPAAHATGTAASGMSSNTSVAKMGGRMSGSQPSLRQAASYCQIISMLHNNQRVVSGDQSGKTSRLQTIQVDNSINVKQYKKVGYKDAKTWMEHRLASMKSGVPNWAATDLASKWCDGLNWHDLYEMIAEIESFNLANQYARWHVPRLGSMSQQRLEGVFRLLLGGQLNSALLSEVHSCKTGDIIRLIKDWEIQGGQYQR